MSQEIQLQTDLDQTDLDRLAAASMVAMDTETLGLDAWRDPLCLVQISDPDGVANVIRSADWRHAAYLKQFLQSATLKIFHNAMFDCAVLLANSNVGVVNPYCTRVASKLARTYGRNHTLAGLAQELLGVELSKELQVSDWSGDLSAGQLIYAMRDVQYLFEIKRLLEDKMRRRQQLRTGLSMLDLNAQCQAMIPGLVQLKLNGWNLDVEEQSTFWGR